MLRAPLCGGVSYPFGMPSAVSCCLGVIAESLPLNLFGRSCRATSRLMGQLAIALFLRRGLSYAALFHRSISLETARSHAAARAVGSWQDSTLAPNVRVRTGSWRAVAAIRSQVRRARS